MTHPEGSIRLDKLSEEEEKEDGGGGEGLVASETAELLAGGR